MSIIEPWRDVGVNPRGEPVRASKNVAYVLQQVADADTILYPVWRSGIAEPARLANVLSAGLATIVQGGNPSVHDAPSFDGGKASLEDLLSLVDQLLLRRSTASGPAIFICLGHQLAAASHITAHQARHPRGAGAHAPADGSRQPRTRVAAVGCAGESSPSASRCRS